MSTKRKQPQRPKPLVYSYSSKMSSIQTPLTMFHEHWKTEQRNDRVNSQFHVHRKWQNKKKKNEVQMEGHNVKNSDLFDVVVKKNGKTTKKRRYSLTQLRHASL